MTLDNILGTAQQSLKPFSSNRHDVVDKANEQLARTLNVSSEAASSIASLSEAHEDAEAAVNQFEEQINDCNSTISNLTSNIQEYDRQMQDAASEISSLQQEIQDLQNALSSLTDAAEIAAKQQEIASRQATIQQRQSDFAATQSSRAQSLSELRTQTVQRNRLENDRYQADQSRRTAERQLNRMGISDITATRQAVNAINAAIQKPMSGGVAGKLGKLKANPWGMAVDGLIKAVEFGIGKMTEYARVNAENALRQMNAVFTTEMNTMKSNLASWDDALTGAYTSQELAYQSQLEMFQATNANTLANTRLANTWTNWIPIWGQINKYQETAMEMEQKLAETRISNATKEISLAMEYAKKTDEYLRKQDSFIHSFQRDMGLSFSQNVSSEKRMLNVGVDLAPLNKTIEEALKIQSQFIGATGRAVNFSNKDYVNNAAIGSLLGDESLANFQSQMQIFNYSVSDSADIMYQMYRDVNKMGLSQKKVTKDVLANLKLANKYDFKNGTKGFIELAKWAENVRFNLSAIGNAVEKGQSQGLEGTITQAARLQVLGGNFAMAANPMAMMLESLSDPEAYAHRIKNSFKGLGTVDNKTGKTTFSNTELLLIRAAAEAWGISTEDAKTMIREDGKKNLVRQFMGRSSLKPEQQDAVINKAQRDAKTGEWYVNTIDGGRMNVADVKESDMQNIVSDNNDEAAIQYAKSTLSVVEKIEVATKAIASKLGAETFEDFTTTASKSIEDLLEKFSQSEGEFVKTIKAIRENAQKEQSEQLKKWGDLYSKYEDALSLLAHNGDDTAVKAKEAINRMRKNGGNTPNKEDAAMIKSSPEARAKANITAQEQETVYNVDTRSDWQKFGDWLSRAMGGDLFGVGDRNIKSGTWVSGEQDAQSIKEAESKRKKDIQDNLTSMQITWGTMKDGVVNSNGSPTLTAAAHVTPIQDGNLQFAQSSPEDHAIFAKIGGPFDKLFNGVFGQVSEIYDLLADNPVLGIGNQDLIHPAPSSAPNSEVFANPYYSGHPSENSAIGNKMQIAPIDVKIHFDGNLNLNDNGKSLNILSQLQNDPLLMRSFTHLISEAISRNMSGGKTVYKGGQLVSGLGFSGN